MDTQAPCFCSAAPACGYRSSRARNAARACFGISLIAFWLLPSAKAAIPAAADIQTPHIGDHALHILSPNVLELSLVNTKDPDPARVDSWDWVNDNQEFVSPDFSSVRVIVNGQVARPANFGFKRRPLYAPLLYWDLRIGNELYLQLTNGIPDGASVQVTNDGSLWPTNLSFVAVADPLRYNPAECNAAIQSRFGIETLRALGNLLCLRAR